MPFGKLCFWWLCPLYRNVKLFHISTNCPTTVRTTVRMLTVDNIDDECKPAAQKPMTSLNCEDAAAAGCWEQVPGEKDDVMDMGCC